MSSLLQISGELPQDHLPCQFARPTRQRHDSRQVGVNSTYGLVLSVGAVDSPSDGSGLTGSGVRRGNSGVGVGVGAGAAGTAGTSVAGASVAGASVDGVFTVAGASVAGASGDGVAVRLPAVSWVPTTRPIPVTATTPTTRMNEVAAAVSGRSTRAKTPWRRPFWASARTSGTMRAVRPAGSTGAGLAWSAETIARRAVASAEPAEQLVRCA